MLDSTLPTLLRIGGGGRFRQISLSWLWDVFGKGLGVEGDSKASFYDCTSLIVDDVA
ncbi:hypothetical protein Q31a_60990 [Aureliella helgolandensis]|uniref:Uncharacterized protein n=1 Tax=Aureliella helgolandensis TaxID=2527968 RepID=A0A518GGI8_9BACT|nr:hypothetical protein Q31a_60990 [Aureliella helgolandensis]